MASSQWRSHHGRQRLRTIELPYIAPLHWASTAGFLKPRATPGVEAIDGDSYRRTVEVDGSAGIIELQHVAEPHLLLRASLGSARIQDRVASRAREIFDLDTDPRPIADHLRSISYLEAAVDACAGWRVPGAWDPFELAVRAILGQQVTVKGATTLTARLVQAFGKRLEGFEQFSLTHLFPDPATLASAGLETVGLTRARAHTIRSFASAVADGHLVLDSPRGLDDAIIRLCELPGIGPWTAHYIAMRAFGEADAFPSGDLGLRHSLARDGVMPSASDLLRIAEAWRPWRAYAAMLLWIHGELLASVREIMPEW